ncbi:MAG: hypothetical protein ABL957_14080 [Parvularculaceae bacterium]
MNWRLGPPKRPAPRPAGVSPAARREGRNRAEAAGLEMAEQEAKLRREKSERLKKLRVARDAADAKGSA